MFSASGSWYIKNVTKVKMNFWEVHVLKHSPEYPFCLIFIPTTSCQLKSSGLIIIKVNLGCTFVLAYMMQSVGALLLNKVSSIELTVTIIKIIHISIELNILLLQATKHTFMYKNTMI